MIVTVSSIQNDENDRNMIKIDFQPLNLIIKKPYQKSSILYSLRKNLSKLNANSKFLVIICIIKNNFNHKCFEDIINDPESLFQNFMNHRSAIKIRNKLDNTKNEKTYLDFSDNKFFQMKNLKTLWITRLISYIKKIIDSIKTSNSKEKDSIKTTTESIVSQFIDTKNVVSYLNEKTGNESFVKNFQNYVDELPAHFVVVNESEKLPQKLEIRNSVKEVMNFEEQKSIESDLLNDDHLTVSDLNKLSSSIKEIIDENKLDKEQTDESVVSPKLIDSNMLDSNSSNFSDKYIVNSTTIFTQLFFNISSNQTLNATNSNVSSDNFVSNGKKIIISAYTVPHLNISYPKLLVKKPNFVKTSPSNQEEEYDDSDSNEEKIEHQISHDSSNFIDKTDDLSESQNKDEDQEYIDGQVSVVEDISDSDVLVLKKRSNDINVTSSTIEGKFRF